MLFYNLNLTVNDRLGEKILSDQFSNRIYVLLFKQMCTFRLWKYASSGQINAEQK